MLNKEELGLYENDGLSDLKEALEKDYASYGNKEAVVKNALIKIKKLEKLLESNKVDNGSITKAIAEVKIMLEHLRVVYDVHINNLMNAERAKL